METRRLATGPRSAAARMSAAPSASGASRSGNSRRTVDAAFAWTSGPDISSSSAAAVGCRSWRVGAEAPTTTILSRSSSRSPPEDAREGDGGDRPRGAVIVDPLALASGTRPGGAAERGVRDGAGEGGEAVDGRRDPTEDAPRGPKAPRCSPLAPPLRAGSPRRRVRSSARARRPRWSRARRRRPARRPRTGGGPAPGSSAR